MQTLEPTAAPPPPPPPAAPLTAGEYLALRRNAAKLTVAQAAALLDRQDAFGLEAKLAVAEADEAPLSDWLVARIAAQVFPIDAQVYANLRDELPAGRICRDCGCSWNDACPGGCAWASHAIDRCTACATPHAIAPALVHAAFDDAELFATRDVKGLRAWLGDFDQDALLYTDDGHEIIGFVLRTVNPPKGGSVQRQLILVRGEQSVGGRA